MNPDGITDWLPVWASKKVKDSFFFFFNYLEDEKQIHNFIYSSKSFSEVLQCQKLKKFPLESNHGGVTNLR